jgi:short-subunit dehydrogenase
MQILIESINKELKIYNIHTKNIFPGPTKTKFFKKNTYINHKPIIKGEDVKKISHLVVKNLFKKKLNIFCQKKTMSAFLIKVFPNII